MAGTRSRNKRRSRLRLFAGLLTAVGLSGVVVFAANADSTVDGTLDYVALGDSYSSGHGASSTYADKTCKRSDSAYPALFFAKYKADQQPSISSSIVNRACTGAKIQDVINNQLEFITGSVEMVTITIGGNDVDFASVATTCVLNGSVTCTQALNEVGPRISALRQPLTDLLGTIRKQAPVANIVISGYPKIFATGSCGALAISEDNRDQMRSLQESMNTLIREVAAASDRVQYADPDGLFNTHRVCDTGDRWINQVSDGIAQLDTGAAYHPNANGQAAMADAVFDAATGFTTGPS
ncbi:SGNH/GDSL hydrolase family protein [Streptomyces neyagawaensis]|uniref:SGNH/GDSL hydrolase family protein n=1 Tax=Streptomyces neyagawaensis TaxID=42238 RepID=UPI00099EAC17|nr:SGNH/GDSL hydrolase family protein [Streptomyces neyagawaensis]MCL6734962.1 SGNH/GDSL hydrolase family protein [Streptomyces neyagawaensis]MDE1684660.1 SGNH/GDSL hydrolase family protein [Streptomyces neyagawaensis]